MTKVFVLINHTLTQRQIAELKNSYGSDCKIVFPPDDIKAYWAQIPSLSYLENESILKNICWLDEAKSNDVILVQGDFGATFMIVDFSLKKGLIPIQSVTKRIETEECEGEKIYRHYIFEHECFRVYKRYQKKEK